MFQQFRHHRAATADLDRHQDHLQTEPALAAVQEAQMPLEEME
jgi:hypothetical protein